MNKKPLLAVIAVLFAAAYLFERIPATDPPGAATPEASSQAAATLQRAFDERRSNVQVQVDGVVMKTLADDTQGSRHQRFILELPGGQTVLIAHNIDLAERVSSLRSGDAVSVYGEYEWNAKGGVLHWTHQDPRGKHVAGWIRHAGRTYQ